MWSYDMSLAKLFDFHIRSISQRFENMGYHQTSNIRRTLIGNTPVVSLRCSWSIACRLCSNYIFILNLTPGCNELGKGKCKTRRETFRVWDLVRFILEVWLYIWFVAARNSLWRKYRHACSCKYSTDLFEAGEFSAIFWWQKTRNKIHWPRSPLRMCVNVSVFMMYSVFYWHVSLLHVYTITLHLWYQNNVIKMNFSTLNS